MLCLPGGADIVILSRVEKRETCIFELLLHDERIDMNLPHKRGELAHFLVKEPPDALSAFYWVLQSRNRRSLWFTARESCISVYLAFTTLTERVLRLWVGVAYRFSYVGARAHLRCMCLLCENFSRRRCAIIC